MFIYDGRRLRDILIPLCPDMNVSAVLMWGAVMNAYSECLLDTKDRGGLHSHVESSVDTKKYERSVKLMGTARSRIILENCGTA